MSYTFTITCHTVEEIERLLAAVRHDVNPAVVEQVQTAATEAGAQAAARTAEQTNEPPKRRGRPPKNQSPESAAPASTETAEPEGQTDAVQDVKPAQAQQTLTLDDAKAALRALQARTGEADMATALGVLGKFNATRISEVKATDYPAFIAECAKAA